MRNVAGVVSILVSGKLLAADPVNVFNAYISGEVGGNMVRGS